MRKKILFALSFFCLFTAVYFIFTSALYLRSVAKGGQADQKFEPHPFLVNTQIPNIKRLESGYPVLDKDGNVTKTGSHSWETNSLGFRDREFTLQKDPKKKRIAILGGSAALGGKTYEETIGRLIEKYFQQKGIDTEVYDFAIAGKASTHEMFLYHTQLVNYNPDILVIFDGRNDAFNACLPKFKSHWDPWSFQQMEILWNANIETFKDYFYTIEKIKRLFVSKPAMPNAVYSRVKEFPNEKYEAHPQIADDYASNLESILTRAASRRTKVIVAFQPTLIWSDKKPLHAYEKQILDNLNPSWIEAMKSLKDPMIEKAQAVVTKLGGTFIDMTNVFDGSSDWIYCDDVHPNDEGNVRMAAVLIKKIEPMIKS